mmetsp:Transcript_22300/g.56377  ORF Transcript_22300/g.56377 Transcript_22300/m.56377 type:complete len:215 (-) Transcript_22300:1318-1962(-)
MPERHLGPLAADRCGSDSEPVGVLCGCLRLARCPVSRHMPHADLETGSPGAHPQTASGHHRALGDLLRGPGEGSYEAVPAGSRRRRTALLPGLARAPLRQDDAWCGRRRRHLLVVQVLPEAGSGPVQFRLHGGVSARFEPHAVSGCRELAPEPGAAREPFTDSGHGRVGRPELRGVRGGAGDRPEGGRGEGRGVQGRPQGARLYAAHQQGDLHR